MKSAPWSLLLLAMVFPAALADDEKAASPDDAFRASERLGRGINLGNALEAPSEGAWGLTLEAKYFDRIKEAGFQSVRIPIRWAAHTGPGPDFTIDPAFFARVDWAIEQAVSHGLVAIINTHHDDELYKEPDKHQPRLEAIWRQIANRYQGQPESLLFELLNEPHGDLTNERWQALFPKLLSIVRESNPNRVVIVGPGNWNSLEHIGSLKLPEDDRRLIATFHYYSPFHFTHQGAEWVEKSTEWKGETWTGTPSQIEALKRDFAKAARWGTEHNRPIFLGEFGAYGAAPMSSRAAWTSSVSREAERLGFSWSYWEFAAGFGAFDKEAGRWRGPLKDALIPPEASKPAP